MSSLACPAWLLGMGKPLCISIYLLNVRWLLTREPTVSTLKMFLATKHFCRFFCLYPSPCKGVSVYRPRVIFSCDSWNLKKTVTFSNNWKKCIHHKFPVFFIQFGRKIELILKGFSEGDHFIFSKLCFLKGNFPVVRYVHMYFCQHWSFTEVFTVFIVYHRVMWS